MNGDLTARTRPTVILLWLLTTGGMLLCQTNSPGMPMGTDSIHAKDDMCLMLGAKVVAGDFFKDLRSRRSDNDFTFSRHGKNVTTFPPRLIVKIEAGIDRCIGREPASCDRCDFQLTKEFMNSLRFEVYWKNGFDLQKADTDVLSVEQSNDLARVAPSAKLWKYELSIRSENVPLRDALVVVLLSPDGRIVSRLSGKLADRS
jgi:hypothetical protein